mmetsp:Transcript_31497/g.98140  ORF Transcript_31497/g.98140 Transcript_31497/m.98140 type:complete len:342 (+) Transcript_31497:106-1131(+)
MSKSRMCQGLHPVTPTYGGGMKSIFSTRDSNMQCAARFDRWAEGADRVPGAPGSAGRLLRAAAGAQSAELRVRRCPGAARFLAPGLGAPPACASMVEADEASHTVGTEIRRRRWSGVTVRTPGASTSHFTPALPAESTVCRMPAYHRPSYSTSTRSPTRGTSTPAECNAWKASRASRVGQRATRMPCGERRWARSTEGSDVTCVAARSSPATRSHSAVKARKTSGATEPCALAASSTLARPSWCSMGAESRSWPPKAEASGHCTMRNSCTVRPPMGTSKPTSRISRRPRSTCSANQRRRLFMSSSRWSCTWTALVPGSIAGPRRASPPIFCSAAFKRMRIC